MILKTIQMNDFELLALYDNTNIYIYIYIYIYGQEQEIYI